MPFHFETKHLFVEPAVLQTCFSAFHDLSHNVQMGESQVSTIAVAEAQHQQTIATPNPNDTTLQHLMTFSLLGAFLQIHVRVQNWQREMSAHAFGRSRVQPMCTPGAKPTACPLSLIQFKKLRQMVAVSNPIFLPKAPKVIRHHQVRILIVISFWGAWVPWFCSMLNDVHTHSLLCVALTHICIQLNWGSSSIETDLCPCTVPFLSPFGPKVNSFKQELWTMQVCWFWCEWHVWVLIFIY